MLLRRPRVGGAPGQPPPTHRAVLFNEAAAAVAGTAALGIIVPGQHVEYRSRLVND